MEISERDNAAAVPESASYFEGAAGVYAAAYQAQTPGGHALRVRQQRVLELIDASAGRVLDVGCGPGFLAEALTTRGCEVWGTDAAPAMIDMCRERCGRPERFSVGDATRLEFPDGFFDAVTCIGVIDHLPNAAAALRELVRVVRPGGDVIVSLPNLTSPYSAWKNFVFLPVVAVLRPMVYGILRRPQPSTPYTLSNWSSWRSVLPSFHDLDTSRGARRKFSEAGSRIDEIEYFNFNVLLSPLDELFPGLAVKAVRAFERLRNGWLRWLGAGYVVRAQKPTP